MVKLNDFVSTHVFPQEVPRGLMARIAGFHPAGPGSIPGVGDLIFSTFFLIFVTSIAKKRRPRDFLPF